MSDLKEKWDEVKERIRKDCDLADVSYNTWIKPLIYHSTVGKTVIIVYPSVQDNFVTYLNNRFKTFFKVAISEILNDDYEISFKLENEVDVKTPSNTETSSNVYNINYENAQLNHEYRFENFVVGKNNQMAHAAALAVAESPGNIYNPLYIYGGPGLGKTHLMHAIGNFILDQNSNKKVLYVSSEQFTNEVIESVRSGNAAQINKVREKYRSVDVLMVDDVQFIIGKDSTQEEFFHTFNALHSSGKQIVISSDKPPKQMETLEERFRSRFEWGLITDIQAPDYETRMAILKNKSDKCELNIGNEVVEYIATNIKSNIRELEGALTKVVAFARLNKVNIDLPLAEEALRDYIYPDKPVNITPSYIMGIVANQFGLNAEALTLKRRTAEIILPRQISMYLCCELTDLSLNDIGSYFGKKDHTTVMHARDKIAETIKKDEELNHKIEVIKNIISPK
jgi:chromosomal replication initiator protein